MPSALNQALQTPRLTLKRLCPADKDLIFALRSDPALIRHTGIKQYESADEAAAYIQKIERDMEAGQCLVWAASLSADQTPVGTVCLWDFSADRKSAELGYDLLPAYWGQGYALEAVQAALAFGFFSYGFENIFAYPRSEHAASCRVLEKAAFRLIEEYMRESVDGNFQTSVYRIIKEEFTLPHSQ